MNGVSVTAGSVVELTGTTGCTQPCTSVDLVARANPGVLTFKIRAYTVFSTAYKDSVAQ